QRRSNCRLICTRRPESIGVISSKEARHILFGHGDFHTQAMAAIQSFIGIDVSPFTKTSFGNGKRRPLSDILLSSVPVGAATRSPTHSVLRRLRSAPQSFLLYGRMNSSAMLCPKR